MRIIDWSSDVCSSDLASAHWRGNICCPTRIRRSGKSDRTNAVQAARKIPPHALPDRAGGYPERRDRTQNVVPVPRDGGYRDQARYRWAHNVAYQARDKPRSEEHTSELQSLMRISYAVFCLKKKKKK